MGHKLQLPVAPSSPPGYHGKSESLTADIHESRYPLSSDNAWPILLNSDRYSG
ncbi:hypothetical protein BDV41DRAFT_532152, partial [Aspergillus transmontanensis]